MRSRIGCRHRLDRGAKCERAGEGDRQCTGEGGEPDRDSTCHDAVSS
jgi:hypothetical protein